MTAWWCSMTMTDLPESTVEQAEQLLDVGEVEAGRRLVEDVDAALLGHLGGQLEPLPLTSGQRRERLAEAEVAEPDVGEPVEDLARGQRTRLAGTEELLGLGHNRRSSSSHLSTSCRHATSTNVPGQYS
jgi:hypothetical protein